MGGRDFDGVESAAITTTQNSRNFLVSNRAFAKKVFVFGADVRNEIRSKSVNL